MKKFLIVLFGIIIFLPLFVFAQKTYTPLVPIPGVTSGAPVNLGVYLGAMYKLLISATIILSVVVITYQGLKHMWSESPFNKSAAKGRILGALGGVLLAATSWLILSTINPCLVEFTFLNPSDKCGGKPTSNLPTNPSTRPLSLFFGDRTFLLVGEEINEDASGSVSGGTGPYTFSMGNLPPGISADSTGKIFGSPTTEGVYFVSMSATDSKGETDSKVFEFTVSSPTPINIAGGTTQSATGKTGVAFNYSPNVINSVPPLTFRVFSPVPPGLIFNSSNGSITGTPTQIGVFQVTMKVSDVRDTSNNSQIDYTLTITVSPAQFCFDGIRTSGGNIGQPGSVCANTLQGCNNLRSSDTSLANKTSCVAR